MTPCFRYFHLYSSHRPNTTIFSYVNLNLVFASHRPSFSISWNWVDNFGHSFTTLSQQSFADSHQMVQVLKVNNCYYFAFIYRLWTSSRTCLFLLLCAFFQRIFFSRLPRISNLPFGVPILFQPISSPPTLASKTSFCLKFHSYLTPTHNFYYGVIFFKIYHANANFQENINSCSIIQP